ncbi:unnamed protein product, partial [Rangifer tarandus platyrhynchus]
MPEAQAWKQMSWFYHQELLVTALYMLEPWEQTVFNSMLVCIGGDGIAHRICLHASANHNDAALLKNCSM